MGPTSLWSCMGGYFGKKCTTTSRTFACKLSLHSDKLKIKPNIQADPSRYYAKESLHNSWNKLDKNRNIIPNFTKEDAVATFQLNTGQRCLMITYAAHQFIRSQCASCREMITAKQICIIFQIRPLTGGNTQSLVKLYWVAKM